MMLSFLTRWLLGTALMLPAALALQAQAASEQIRSQAPGYYRTMLGDYEITALSDGTAALPVDELLLNTSREKVRAALKANYLPLPAPVSVNAYLINTGARLILIDTGGGALFGDALGKLAANLRAAGYQPEQVDEIYLTHLHTDHVGGLTRERTAQFPNAVVRMAREEADYWLSEENLAKAPAERKAFFEGVRASLAPYIASGRLQPFEGEPQLAPGIRPIMTRGHTPGHCVYVVESAGQKFMVLGDLIHVAAVQFAHPEVAIQFDSDPREAVNARKRTFDDAARRGYLVGAAHLSFPGLGHIRARKPGYLWIPVEYQSVP